MIIKMFSVLDQKTGVFSHPFYEVTTGSAIRAFTDTVQTKDHPFNRHPDDYSLYFIGEYDDATASINGMIPQVLVTAMNVITE